MGKAPIEAVGCKEDSFLAQVRVVVTGLLQNNGNRGGRDGHADDSFRIVFGLTPNGISMMAWTAPANSALAFSMWNWSLRAIPAQELTMPQDLTLVETAPFPWCFW